MKVPEEKEQLNWKRNGIDEQFHRDWKQFYASYEEDIGKHVQEFLMNLRMIHLEIDRTEYGTVDNSHFVYRYLLSMQTNVQGETLAFTCEHLDPKSCPETDLWVTAILEKETALTIQDAEYGIAVLHGHSLNALHPSLTRRDAELIGLAFDDFELVGWVEQRREKILEKKDKERIKTLKGQLEHLPIEDIQLEGEKYVILFKGGTKVVTEPNGLIVGSNPAGA